VRSRRDETFGSHTSLITITAGKMITVHGLPIEAEPKRLYMRDVFRLAGAAAPADKAIAPETFSGDYISRDKGR
jgi:hypothetical protein